jgi:hypothetical protein
MSNYRIKYGIITNNLKWKFGLCHCDGLVETIEMDISFAYNGVRMHEIWERQIIALLTCAWQPRVELLVATRGPADPRGSTAPTGLMLGAGYPSGPRAEAPLAADVTHIHAQLAAASTACRGQGGPDETRSFTQFARSRRKVSPASHAAHTYWRGADAADRSVWARIGMDSDVWKSELSVFVSAKNVNMDIRIHICF